MNLNKNSVAIRLPLETVYMFRGGEYARKIKRVIIHEPTTAEWEQYDAAKEAHEFLLSSPYFEDGGPDEGSRVVKPERMREYIYAETHEEWLARCQRIDKGEA